MQIFFVDRDPAQAARSLMDQHVIKMAIESLQLLSTAWHIAKPDSVVWKDVETSESRRMNATVARPFLNGMRIYLATHEHGRLASWVAESKAHYAWLWQHAAALVGERQYRFNTPVAGIQEPLVALGQIPDLSTDEWIDPPLLVDDDLVDLESVDAYREHYRRNKAKLGRWTERQPPEWLGPAVMKDIVGRQAIKRKK